MSRHPRIATLALALLLAPLGLRADAAADRILDRAAVAIGEPAAVANIKTRLTEYAAEIPAAGLTMTSKVYQQRPNFYLSENNLPGIGMMYQGHDGATAWALDPLQGYRVLENDERTQLLLLAAIGTEAEIKARFAERVALPDVLLGDRPQQQLRVSGPRLPTTTLLFDTQTGLLTQMSLTVDAGDQGQVPVKIRITGYQVFDGVKVPSKMESEVGPLLVIMTLKNLRHNVPMPADTFKPRPQ
jgi:hypothetical protein